MIKVLFIVERMHPGIDESHELENYQNIQLDHYIITPLPLSHDATSPLGFVIKGKDETILYMTDTGYVSQKNMEYIKISITIFLKSNHDIEMLMNTRRPFILKKIVFLEIRAILIMNIVHMLWRR